MSSLLAAMFSFLSLLWIWRKKAAENTEFLLRGRKCQSSCYFVAFACFALDLEKEGTRTRIGFQEQNCIAAFGSGCISSDEVSLRGRKC